ncbi:MAG: CBS domain-containing protein [Syntrophobacterales bacterium]
MHRTIIREFLDSLRREAELPLVPVGACLEEVVRVMVKGHRRRIVYVVDGDRRLKGAITLSHLKDRIFRFFLDERLGNAVVVSERIVELFTSEKAEQVMTLDLPSCLTDETLADAVGRMMATDVTDMPVLDQEGRVVADLDILDLLELWLRRGNQAFT